MDPPCHVRVRVYFFSASATAFKWIGAALLSLAPGPHPRRELTLMPRLGFPCPRLGMAAGAYFFTGAGAPPPARADADASPRISLSSARHGRRRLLLHWRRGPTPSSS